MNYKVAKNLEHEFVWAVLGSSFGIIVCVILLSSNKTFWPTIRKLTTSVSKNGWFRALRDFLQRNIPYCRTYRQRWIKKFSTGGRGIAELHLWQGYISCSIWAQCLKGGIKFKAGQFLNYNFEVFEIIFLLMGRPARAG